MKLILAEAREGQQPVEHAFEKALVVAGRDPQSCDIVFEQAAWPMVSRRHAEFRLKNGRCLLVDANSSFGTYVNSQRVAEPVEVTIGSSIQLGAGGPLLLVVHLEDKAAASLTKNHETQVVSDGGAASSALSSQVQPERRPYTSAAPLPTQQRTPSVPASPATAPLAYLEYISGMSSQPQRLRLDQSVILLGRDHSSAMPIDADAAAVSRRHAEIRRQDNATAQEEDSMFTIVDLHSFNGTLLNEQRIAAPAPLYDGDRIQLGMGGPVFRFVDPAHHRAPDGGAAHGENTATPAAGVEAPNFQRTMVVRGTTSGAIKQDAGGAPVSPSVATRLLVERAFDVHREQLTVGRAENNDVRLDGLQISNYHARFYRNANGVVAVEDAGSTNGVYVNGERITNRRALGAEDNVQIGPFVLKADPTRGVAVYDSRSKTRIDVSALTKIVANRGTGRSSQIKLLDDVSLAIEPNEFVGLLGPSGAGKSTLMDALNGMRPATSGQVLYNELDLYQHPESLKQSIGYVPQDDIIHRELTVYRTLYYVARLRLSHDVSKPEIDQIIGEVLDVTNLTERRDVPVAQLSGGQRKRVSIAVELITKPSVIFLDEPTSGLDPATEDKIMRLFRQIAESGRTVILTTHAMENVALFDKIVVLMRGRLVFYGTPQEALAYLGADNFKDLYDKLEAPIEAQLQQQSGRSAAAPDEAQREELTERVAIDWQRRFTATEMYARNVARPLGGLQKDATNAAVAVARHRASAGDAIRQWLTLARRYMEVLGRDRLNLLILFGQAPLVALFTYLVMSARDPRDFPYFLLALVAIWFGTSIAAREIVKERPIYNRERRVNLGLWPYIGSKLIVLLMLVSAQCLLLFGTLKLLHLAGLFNFPGAWWGLPQLCVMILTGAVGIALGLLVSSVVKTSEMATSIVPLLLIPQILFSGLVGVPAGLARVAGAVMPAVWSFDAMKRYSTLDTLKEEGSKADGENKGLGLYKFTEEANDANIAGARRDLTRYGEDATAKTADYERQMKDYLAQARANPAAPPSPPAAPQIPAPPVIPDAQKVSDDLSRYINFLHPWGGPLRDPLILVLMFLLFAGATLIALRARDAGQ